MTAVSGSVFTAAQFNTFVRDNLLMCPASIASTPGSLFVTDSSNSVVERIPVTANIATQEAVTATSFSDAPTPGPSVTAVTGQHAIIVISAEMGNVSSASAGCLAGVLISGATSEVPSFNNELRQESNGTAEFQRCSTFRLHTGLTPGSNTFKMQYMTLAGTMNIAYREITVLPL
jgi:hypothetical protein